MVKMLFSPLERYKMIYTRVVVVRGSNILEILKVELIGFADGFPMGCESNGVNERKVRFLFN